MARKTDDAGAAEVQKNVDAEQEKGFRGERVDPTPLDNYTVSGVTSGAPTPETDEGAHDEADKRAREVARSEVTPK